MLHLFVLGQFVILFLNNFGDGLKLARRLTVKEKFTILNRHNALRREAAISKLPHSPTASNMLIMRWDMDVERQAQNFADKCNGPDHDPSIKMGYNLIKANSPYNLEERAITIWSRESNDYQWRDGKQWNYVKLGHYMQIIWATTNRLGCGYNKCGRIGRFACFYNPPGAIPKLAPYKVGTPCTACPPKFTECYLSLCGPKNFSDHVERNSSRRGVDNYFVFFPFVIAYLLQLLL